MNGDTFYDWFCGVLSKLKKNSVIVMDNASYHSIKKDPISTIAWKKDKIVQWLTTIGCIVDTSLVKQLLEKMQEIRHHHDKYVIDEVLKLNKVVLHLPPYHCEVNAIELAWSVVKNNNTSFKINDVQKLLIDGIKLVTPEMWANFVNHTIKEEDKLCTIDNNTDTLLDQDTSHVMLITGDTSSDFFD